MQTQPRSLGFARYPSWRTRDWDPVMYRYGLDEIEKEDSPQQLLSYRKEYAAALKELGPHSSSYLPHDTSLSQIVEAIFTASSSELCRPWIMMKLLQWPFNDKVPFKMTTEPHNDEIFESQVAPRK